MKVKIAAAQMIITPESLQENYLHIKDLFEKSAKEQCDFLVLPEECWVGLGYTENTKNEVADFVKDRVSQLCKKYQIYCIAGTVIEEVKESSGEHHIHNISYVFDIKGKILGYYAKRHPVPATEKDRKPGETHKVFDTEFGKIGVQICRDILYPETTKVMADMGAKIIFSPAFWSKFSTAYPSSLKYHHIDELQMIKYLVPARALENEVIFVFCNAAGTYKIPERSDTLLGYTQICEPFIGPLEVLRHNHDQLLIKTVDTKMVDEMRLGWKSRGH